MIAQPVVLIVDSLDQLRDHGAGLREWIPKSLPPTVTMVMSAIPADEFIVGPELKVKSDADLSNSLC